jgi:general secretion pathway protein D
VIDKLDGRRAQVLVESLIVEVNANKLAEFGIQWQGVMGKQGDGTVGVIGTNSGAAGANILGITSALASGNAGTIGTAVGTLGGGLNLALAPRVNGQYYLGALANFLQNSGDANVLSTPNLMTLDNEEAKIVIGNNVPFVTGLVCQHRRQQWRGEPVHHRGAQGRGPDAARAPADQRKRHGQDGDLPGGLEDRRRHAQERQRPHHQQALHRVQRAGGRRQHHRAGRSAGRQLRAGRGQGAPDGRHPRVGNLFRSENRSRKKTNLMVFLRPVVVRDAAASDALMIDRYEAIRALQQQVQPSSGTVLGNVQGAPVLTNITAALAAPHGAQHRATQRPLIS